MRRADGQFCKDRLGWCAVTYDARVARMRESIKKGETRGAVIGTCGEYRFLMESSMGASTSYFDQSGALVGGTGMGDTPAEHCGKQSFGSGYGLVPKCVEQRMEVLHAHGELGWRVATWPGPRAAPA